MKMGRPARAAAWVATLWLGAAAFAADTPAARGGIAIDFAAIAKEAASAPAPAPAAANGEPTLEPGLALKDQADYLDYVRWQRDYARRGWEWHLMSTQALFAIVLGIVGFGLWITWHQFKRDYTGRGRTPRRAVNGAKAAGEGEAASVAVPPPETVPLPLPSAGSIKVGPAGLELTSQIVGLLVLAMSLAFFYLYVKEVYPMSEAKREAAVQPPTPAQPASKPK